MKEYGIGGYTNKIDVFSYGVCLWEMASRSKQNPLSGLFEDRVSILKGRGLTFLVQRADTAWQSTSIS